MKRDLSNLTHWLKKFLNIIRFFYPISQEDCEKEVLEKVPENWNFDRKNRNFDRKNRNFQRKNRKNIQYIQQTNSQKRLLVFLWRKTSD